MHVRELVVPVERAGLYVPGGRAAYPSTVLMTAIPARIAGVPEIVLCVPPNSDTGLPPDATLAAAALAGVDEVYRIGGAQAIAAMAYGTDSIAPVDVIVGPGNRYVTVAKREVQGVVGIESLAAESELAVIADGSTNPEWVAADLLAQAEHGPGGLAVVITWNEEFADAVDAALTCRLEHTARRAEAAATLFSGGRLILVDDATDAIAVANTIAPEHLQLMNADPEMLVARGPQRGRGVLRPLRARGHRRLRRRHEPRPADERHRAVRERAARVELPETHPRRDPRPSRARARRAVRDHAGRERRPRRARGDDRGPQARGPRVNTPRPQPRDDLRRARGLPLRAGRRAGAAQHEREPVPAAARVPARVARRNGRGVVPPLSRP